MLDSGDLPPLYNWISHLTTLDPRSLIQDTELRLSPILSVILISIINPKTKRVSVVR